MLRHALGSCVRSSIVVASCLAAAWAQSPAQAAIAVTAVATASPPAITFTWPSDPTATLYSVVRRVDGASVWGLPVVVPGAGAAVSWVDTNVVPGARYEYWFTKNGTPPARSFLTSGIEAVALEHRGTLVLLVDATHAVALAAKIDRLIGDLRGDGWFVVRHDVLPSQSPASVKALIAADYFAADPANTKAVFALGHVPVPYSGNFAPDGHPDHQGAWAADVWYGEMNGTWTDGTVNTVSASRLENRNVPGDGKFDQSTLPSDVELIVGRVDFANMPAFPFSEATLLANYLDKDHDYRHRVFQVDQRAIVDDNFGWFSGEAFAVSGWRNFTTLLGAANVTAADYFTTLNTTTGNGHVWSYGCGGGSYTSAGGIGTTSDFVASANRSVFTMLFGSYFGDWDSTNNFLRAPLCTGWTLANVWAGRPHWSFHPMGLGDTIGACVRRSQNDTAAGGIFTRGVHMALMGDPTLRQHVVAPPTNVTVGTAALPVVAWAASADPVAGYHVYRAPVAAGPFTRLTTATVTGPTFVDSAPIGGLPTYMVRALRLETTPSGSYWNLSQGIAASAPRQPASHTSYGTGCYTPPLGLAAAPAPVSTPTTGTVVTYTISALPETAPGSGTYLGILILSLTPDFAGTSLASLGLPGCSLHVGSFDALLGVAGTTPSLTVPFPIAAGTPYGTRFYATALGLFAPGSLPGGQNAFGGVTSNGVESFLSDF